MVPLTLFFFSRKTNRTIYHRRARRRRRTMSAGACDPCLPPVCSPRAVPRRPPALLRSAQSTRDTAVSCVGSSSVPKSEPVPEPGSNVWVLIKAKKPFISVCLLLFTSVLYVYAISTQKIVRFLTMKLCFTRMLNNFKKCFDKIKRKRFYNQKTKEKRPIFKSHKNRTF